VSTSGADLRVYKFNHHDAKVARRLYEQAYWLTQHDDPGLVRVGRMTYAGYEMEMLTPPKHPIRAESVVTILERAVWNRPAWTTWDLGKALDYFAGLECGEELWTWLLELGFGSLRVRGTTPPAFQECDTHGDPTFENVLARGDQLVLVDPIPADGRMPSVRALDLGKIGQSLIGYEGVKAGKFTSFDVHRARGLRRYCRSEEEFRAAMCFTAIHVARLIPYQEEEQKAFWRDHLPGIIADLKRV
jgi:hypothetical protein